MLPQLKNILYSNYIGLQIYIPTSTVCNNSVNESPVTLYIKLQYNFHVNEASLYRNVVHYWATYTRIPQRSMPKLLAYKTEEMILLLLHKFKWC